MIKPQVQSHKTSEESNLPNNRLMINLLPLEIILNRKQHFKLKFISKISIIVLLILIFFTSSTLALRFSQTFELKEAEQGLAMAETKVTDLKDKEGQAIALKKRLDSISSILGSDNLRKAIFNMIIYLVPPNMQVLEVNVGKNGDMNIDLESASLSSIQILIDGLGDKEKNSDLISKVDLDGLSLGKNAVYHFSLKIIPKKKANEQI